MKTISGKRYVMTSVVICALAMSMVDGVIQPGYVLKSIIKICLFLFVPVLYFLTHREDLSQFKALFIPDRKNLLRAFGLGIAVYGLIVGGYHLVTLFLDLTQTILSLTGQSGVSAENFLAISLYISFVNSFLEEFFFRGFAFITLKKKISPKSAYIFSAACFALYHLGMFLGEINIPIWIAAMAGLFIAGIVLNWLNDKSGNIYVSWLVHMFANFAINTVGFLVFGMI